MLRDLLLSSFIHLPLAASAVFFARQPTHCLPTRGYPSSHVNLDRLTLRIGTLIDSFRDIWVAEGVMRSGVFGEPPSSRSWVGIPYYSLSKRPLNSLDRGSSAEGLYLTRMSAPPLEFKSSRTSLQKRRVGSARKSEEILGDRVGGSPPALSLSHKPPCVVANVSLA